MGSLAPCRECGSLGLKPCAVRPALLDAKTGAIGGRQDSGERCARTKAPRLPQGTDPTRSASSSSAIALARPTCCHRQCGPATCRTSAPSLHVGNLAGLGAGTCAEIVESLRDNRSPASRSAPTILRSAASVSRFTPAWRRLPAHRDDHRWRRDSRNPPGQARGGAEAQDAGRFAELGGIPPEQTPPLSASNLLGRPRHPQFPVSGD